MMRFVKFIGLGSCLTALVACGGGGGGGGNAPEVVNLTPGAPAVGGIDVDFPRPTTFDGLQNIADDLLEQNRAIRNGGEFQRITGTANYLGIAAFVDGDGAPGGQIDEQDEVIEDPRFLAEVRYSADFDTNTFNGQLDNFVESNGTAIESDNVRISSSGIVDRTQGIFRGDISGTITIDGAERELSGDANGQFYFPNATGIRVGLNEVTGSPVGGGADTEYRGIVLATRP